MTIEIIVGNEPYLIDKRVKELAIGYEVVKSYCFSEEEVTALKQKSLFGDSAVIIYGKIDKDSENLFERYIESESSLDSVLVYVPGYEDKRKRIFKSKFVNQINKPEKVVLLNILSNAMEENNIPYDKKILDYLVDYSEYYDENSVTLYDLLGVIRASSGTALTKEHIERNVIRSEKDNAFKLISLVGKKEELIAYMGRLSTNPYAIIGALLYSFRIMAKLKISDNIGINSYQLNQYSEIKNRWSLDEIITKMKLLNELKVNHESKEVMKSLILSILLE